MKKIVLLSVLFFVMMFSLGQARATTGVGIVFGLHGSDTFNSDVGLSLKFNNFPVLGIKYALGNNGYLGGTIDYWMINNALGGRVVYWYLGVGGYAWISSNPGLGGRLPIGLQFWPVHRFEIFLEAAPAIGLIPSVDFNVQGALGLRYHF